MSRRFANRPLSAYPFYRGPFGPGAPGTFPGGFRDPEENRNAPDLEDPEENRNAPELEDPEENRNAPELEDPDGLPFPWPAAYGWPVGYGYPFPPPPAGCCCDDEADGEAGTQGTRPGRFRYSGFVILRLVPGIFPELDRQNLYELTQAEGLDGLRKALTLEDDPAEEPVILEGRPLVRDDCGGDVFRDLRRIEEQAATGPFPPLRSLLSYWRLDLRRRTEEEAVALVVRLRGLAVVDHAYRELAAVDTAEGAGPGRATATFTAAQGYLEDAPVGLGARWARDRLGTPSARIRAVDVEQRWSTKHQDITGLPGGTIFGHNRAKVDGRYGHGTAVCGQLIGDGRVEGIADGLVDLSLSSHYDREAGHNGNVAEAIVRSILPFEKILGPGDLLILEVQRSFYPTEIDDADFDAVRLATARGITVFEAAGNGGWDLDAYVDSLGRRILARGQSGFRDSGAILVGAARSAVPHRRMRSSNYGCRVDVYGWGEDVFTCGYGDFDPGGDPDRHLTDDFRGTSAATAMLAGAGALVQCLYRAETGEGTFLRPARLREILSNPETGTPQGPGVPGPIGVMPDLRRILLGDLGLLASPYARKGPGDDGTRPWCGDLWSCPDVFLPGSLQATASPPAGGSTAISGRTALDIFVRLENRGFLDARGVEAQVFHGPPATLIVPGAWRELGRTRLDVPRGAGAVKSPAIPWQPPGDAAEHPSLLVLTAPSVEDLPTLPAGDPGRSFEDYLDLLGTDAAACCNVHRVEAGPRPKVDFEVTGAPDRLRSFDLEVIQRLPRGVRARLEGLDPFLALALTRGLGRRRDLQGQTGLDLPAAPRVHLEGVRLPRNACFPTALVLVPDGGSAKSLPAGALDAGASVVIRQLFRGREMGRITFVFD